MTTLTGAHHVDVDALGVSVRIDLAEVPAHERALLAEAWSGARVVNDASPASVVIPHANLPFDDLVADVSTRVTLAAISAQRGRLWMVHAGAVADESGRVVLFSGRSGMGKTTLMSRLAREFAYVTDESVGVTADGRVLPYRKPLSVIAEAQRPKHQLSPARLGLRELPSAPLHLHAIVVLDRDESVPAAQLEPLDLPDALGAIAPQCSFLSELPTPLRALTAHIESVGGALRLRYSEGEDALPLLRRLLASAPRPSVSTVEQLATGRGSTGAGFVRTPILDAVRIGDDRMALLRRSADGTTTLHIIDGIGPTLWHAADGVSFDELVAAAVRRHGAPVEGDAPGTVRSAVEALRTTGLLEERSGT